MSAIYSVQALKTQKAMEVQAFIHIKRYGRSNAMKNKQLLPLNLQLFADGEPNSDSSGGNGSGQATPPEFEVENLTDEQLATIKEKFGFKDDDDVDAIVKSKRSRWQKEAEAEKKEAERLAKMNKDEKAEHERKQLEARIAEYERKENLREMSKVAEAMLKEQEVRSTEAVLNILVSEDADKTKEAVKEFADYIKEERKLWEVERNTGKTPSKVPNNTGSFSSIVEDQKLLNQHRIIK